MALSWEEEDELRAVFGAPPPGSPGRAYAENLLANMRARCTHDQIMSGRCPIPQGYGFGEGVRILGGALKAIAPFVAFVPGFGTALAVAMSAAGSLALGERIDEMILSTASAAMPPGIPRVAFDAGADITTAIVRGDNVGAVVLRVARETADAAGGEPAAAAFDTGVAVARGEPLSPAALAALRSQAAQGGTAAAAAFDAGETLARGGQASAALLAAGRAYVKGAGGDVALVAFDTGVALAQGQAIQDAGYSALKSFARGNSAAERAVAFGEAMGRAAREGRGVAELLESDLVRDFRAAGGSALRGALGDTIERLKGDPALAELGSGELARLLATGEEVARAALAIVRGGDEDEALRVRLVGRALEDSIARSAQVDVRAAGDFFGIKARAITPTTLLEVARLSRSAYVATAPKVATTIGPSFTQAMGVHAPKVQAAPPRPLAQSDAPRAGTSSNVALGVTVAAAAVALFYWARR